MAQEEIKAPLTTESKNQIQAKPQEEQKEAEKLMNQAKDVQIQSGNEQRLMRVPLSAIAYFKIQGNELVLVFKEEGVSVKTETRQKRSYSYNNGSNNGSYKQDNGDGSYGYRRYGNGSYDRRSYGYGRRSYGYRKGYYNNRYENGQDRED